MSESATRLRCLLRMRASAQEGGVSLQQQHAALQALSEKLDCASDAFRILDTQDNGQVVTLEMTESLFADLLRLSEADEQDLQRLGVVLIRELLDQPCDLGRIRRMLAALYSDEELRDFCRQYFPELSSERGKAETIEAVVDLAARTSRLPHILAAAEGRNAKLCKQYGPYYLPTRIFPSGRTTPRLRPASFRQPFFTLTFSRALSAFLAGSGLAAGLTFLLQRVMLSVSDPFFRWLLLGGIALIGLLTGEAVLNCAGHKRGRFLALIAVSSYLVGSVLGNLLLILSMMRFHCSIELCSAALIAALWRVIGSGLASMIGLCLAFRLTR